MKDNEIAKRFPNARVLFFGNVLCSSRARTFEENAQIALEVLAKLTGLTIEEIEHSGDLIIQAYSERG